MTSAGSVQVEFDGDATGAVSAVDAVLKKLAALEAAETQLVDALSDSNRAANMSESEMKSLKEALQATSAQIDKMTGASKTAAVAVDKAGDVAARAARNVEASGRAATSSGHSFGRLGAAGEKIDNVFGPLQTTISGLGQAMGGSAQRAADLAGGIADIGMSMSRGGGLLAVAAAVGAVLALVVNHFREMEKAAEEAANKSAEKLADLRKEVQDLEDALRSLKTGTKIDIIRTQRDIVDAQETASAMGGALKDKYGVGTVDDMDRFYAAAQNNLDVWVDRWNEAGTGFERVRVAAKDVVTEFREAMKAGLMVAELQQKLAKLQETDAEEKAQAAIDRAVDEANRAESRHQQDAAKAQAAALDAPTKSEVVDDLRAFFADYSKRAVQTPATYASQADIDAMNADFLNAVDNASGAFEMTADELAALNEEFLNVDGATQDMTTDLMTLTDRIGEFIDGLDMADVSGAVATVASGGFEAGGAALGTTVGGIVDVATAGATGGLGAVIGGILGGILGKALDELISALQILTPLFDAVAVIIAAFEPILLVLGELFRSLADTIVNMAPLLLTLTKPIAALLLVVVRLVQLILPFADSILIATAGLLMFLDFITRGISWLDEHFFIPLADGANALYNGFATIVNMIIEFIRDITGDEKWGTKMTFRNSGVRSVIDDFATSIDDLIAKTEEESEARDDAIDSAADANTQWEEEVDNIPSGYKLAERMFAAQEGEQQHGKGREETNIYIENWNSKGRINDDVRDLKLTALRGRKAKVYGGRREVDDEKG